MIQPLRGRRLGTKLAEVSAMLPALGTVSGFLTLATCGFLALATCVLATCVLAAETPGAASPEAQHAGQQFFERKVRPVFVEHCFKCHAGEKQKGGLKIESLQGLLTGGDSGPAIVPGDAEHSLLIQAIHWGDDAVQMPPAKKLPDPVIADLTQWVQMGAPWPGADRAAMVPPAKKSPKVITDEDRQWWAFQPIRRPAISPGEHGPIDALILARLAEKKITANAPATRRELIRRASFDLIGLPPTPEEVERFEQDSSAQAYERLIDELLARPEYGERWARHWLDVVRYAQSNGYERDGEKPLAWRYRDYVIRAFNDDKPYDRFVLEQLAGDELDDVTDDSIIATGYYRLGVWDDEPDDPRAAEFDGLDDVMVTTGAAFMGMTLGCARCHDHRFDPIPQDDYYRLLSFFRNIRSHSNSPASDSSSSFVPLGDRAAIAQRFEKARAETKSLQEQLKGTKDGKERRRLEQEIETLTRQLTGPVEWALAVRDGGDQPTHVLIRGNAGMPGDKVEPGFLSVLTSSPPVLTKPQQAGSSGRRLALARWLTSPDHPLTARVMANRIWKHHFGRGIVATTSDFGHGGTSPTHPQLLDWLAAEFIAGNWSVKRLHKTIMLSEAYQRSSRSDNPGALAGDPANELLWRQNLRRLEAESIRDALLVASGQLNRARGGRGFFPHLAGEVLAGESRPGNGWELSTAAEQNRRSIYAFIKRSMVPPMLEGFDFAATASPLAERSTTTVAPQALIMLNDQFVQQQAGALAQRLEREVTHDSANNDSANNDSAARIQRLYELTLQRPPTEREAKIALVYLQRQTESYRQIMSRLTFSPDVPLSLHSSYLKRLQASDYLFGPTSGWSYYKGKWTGGYESIFTVDRDRGPFALWQGPAFADGVIEGELTLQNAVEFGSIIFRATAEGDVFRGYEAAFSPRDDEIVLRRHGADVTLLGQVELPIATGRPVPVKIEAAGARIRVWFGGDKPVLDVTDPQPLQDAGRLGARSWGAAMSIDHWTVTTAGQGSAGNKRFDVAAPIPASESGSPHGPLAGWKTFGGQWSVEGSVCSVAPVPGGKAIFDEVQLSDGTVEADVLLRDTRGDAGIVLRVNQATDGVDALQAYNINFLAGGLRLGKHQNNWRELKRVSLPLAVNQWRHVRVELQGARIRIFVDNAGEPQIDFTDEQPLGGGSIGLRTFNASMSVRDVKVTVGDQTTLIDIRPAKAEPAPAATAAAGPSPQQRALASLCLLIMNLNEFVYVD